MKKNFNRQASLALVASFAAILTAFSVVGTSLRAATFSNQANGRGPISVTLAGPDAASYGSTVTFVAQVKNASAMPVSHAFVTINQQQLVNVRTVQSLVFNATKSSAGCSLDARGTVTCAMDSLKAGKAISFRVSYNVKLCVPAIVTQATVNVMDGRVARRVRSNLVGLTIDGCSPSDHK